MEARLPQEKLRRLKQEIRQWEQRRSCTKRELLDNSNMHASQLLEEDDRTVREMHYTVRLNKSFRSGGQQMLDAFLLQVPGARRQPREIPEELLKCLVEEQGRRRAG